MKLSVLFVDDEVNVLAALRRRLRPKSDEWEMCFAGSAHEALRALADKPFDVVVSDMRMPGMDGAALLERVREIHPAAARIVLSGHADPKAVLHAMAVAQQFLPKPCEPMLLENTIQRVGALQAAIHDESVRTAVGRIACLPSPPQVYLQFMAAMSEGRATMDEVAGILRQDGAMCAQVLHIANSALCSPARQVLSVDQAVTYLGLDTIRQLVLVAGIFRQSAGQTGPLSLATQYLQRHAMLTASIASAMLDDERQRETAFVAALLHDIGKLLTLAELPERTARVAAAWRAEDGATHVTEKRLFGVTHAEIGGYLLGLWRLPFPIVEAVTYHHAPARFPSATFDVLTAVHVADCLANELAPTPLGGLAGVGASLDLVLLERLGVLDRLDVWRADAARRAEALSPAVLV